MHQQIGYTQKRSARTFIDAFNIVLREACSTCMNKLGIPKKEALALLSTPALHCEKQVYSCLKIVTAALQHLFRTGSICNI
jgi:hypothetical protein